MLEFVKTIPANCKKIKETYAQSEAFVMVKMKEVGKATGRARRSLSWLVAWS